jgi:general secretion pathway protein G
MHKVKPDQQRVIRAGGFTLVEILLAIGLVGGLAALAFSNYQAYVERARVYQAVTDIAAIFTGIQLYFQDAREYPASLAIIGAGAQLDPWGRPYEYLNLTTRNGNGGARRDKKLNPLNSDFDLYSRGKDGLTRLPHYAKR